MTITGGAGGGGGATELNGLSDVTLDTVGDGEVLVYDSATSDFINQTFAEAGISATGHTHTLSDITDAGTMAGETAADYTPTSGLATVATTGAYSDLSGKPTLGTAAATASTDYATSVQGGLADSALQSADIGVSVQAYDAVLDATTASFTTDDESKLDGIAAGAEVNVQSDWDAESGDAFIANKPTLGTAAAAATGDFATAAQGALADSALQSGDVGTMAAETATDYYTKTAADALYDGKQATGDYVTSTDVTAIVELTQAAYDALDPVVATTLYVIVG